METKRPPQHAAPDPHVPQVQSTHHHGTDTATEGQCHGPWKRYQLQVENGRFILPGMEGDEDGSKRSALDPATRAGCVPATAYPSFRTLPPPPAAAANRHRLPRVSYVRCGFRNYRMYQFIVY